MREYRQYVLKRKWLNRRKIVIIFRRNNLSIADFIKIDEGWMFEEHFSHYGTECFWKIVIHGNDIFSMYELDMKTMKIKGSPKHFGVFLRFPKENVPFKKRIEHNNVECFLECTGNGLRLDNGNGFKNKKSVDYPLYKRDFSPECRKAVDIPETVRWSVVHPLQGGGFSTR